MSLKVKQSELKKKESELIKNLKNISDTKHEKRIKNRKLVKLNLNVPSSVISRNNNNNNNNNNNSENIQAFSHNSDRGDYLKTVNKVSSLQTDWQSATAPMNRVKETTNKKSAKYNRKSIKITKVDDHRGHIKSKDKKSASSSSSDSISPVASSPVLRSYGYLSPKRAMKLLSIESNAPQSTPLVLDNVKTITDDDNDNNNNIDGNNNNDNSLKLMQSQHKMENNENDNISNNNNNDNDRQDNNNNNQIKSIQSIKLTNEERKRLLQLEMASRTWKNKENYLVTKCMKAEEKLRAIESLQYEKQIAILSKQLSTLEMEHFKVIDELKNEQSNHKASVRALSKELSEKNQQVDKLIAKISALRHQLAQSNAELIRSKDQHQIENAEQFANSIAKYTNYSKSIIE